MYIKKCLEVELEASADLVAAAGQIRGIRQRRNGQFATAVERSSVRQGQLSVVSQNESVAGAAGARLLTGDSQAGAAVVISDSGGQLQVGIDLVVEHSAQIVSHRSLHGAVHATLGAVESKLLLLDGAVEAEAELGTDGGGWASGDGGVKVERVLHVGVEVDVGLVVAPRELHLVEGWDWAAGNWEGSASGHLGNVVVLKLAVDSLLTRVQGLLHAQTGNAWHGLLDLAARSNSITLQRSLGGELEAVALAGELDFVVVVLKALLEEVIALFGEIGVFDWHVESG